MHAKVDRDVQHLRAFRKIHAQEENVAPAAVGQVHAHGRGFAQDGVSAVDGGAPAEFGADAQRLVGGMAHAEHPLVAAHRAHAAAHLVGERLEAEPMIGGGQGAAQAVAGPMLLLRLQEDFDGFFETAMQQVFVAFEGNQARARSSRAWSGR